MNISTRAKALVGAVAIGGAAVAMGGAFTAGGFSDGAAESVVIGGEVTQTVQGATVTEVGYNFDALNGDTITGVDLTFSETSNIDGRTLTVDLDQSTSTCTVANTQETTTCDFEPAVPVNGTSSDLKITLQDAFEASTP